MQTKKMSKKEYWGIYVPAVQKNEIKTSKVFKAST